MERLCLDIINSNHIGAYRAKLSADMLDNEEWLHTLINKWNLDAETPVKPHDLKALRELRSSMQEVVGQLNLDAELCNKGLNKINSFLEKTPCQIKLVSSGDDYSISKTPLCDDWSHVIWNVAYSFVELISEYDRSRLRICENEDCGWIFYDESKSKTRRWCDHKLCGNMMKLRRYRERQKKMKQL